MDEEHKIKTPLLMEKHNEGSSQYSEAGDEKALARPCNHFKVYLSLLILSVTSVFLSLYLILGGLRSSVTNKQSVQNHGQSALSTLMGKSAYTGLGLDTPKIHWHHTNYWGMNETLADNLWDGVDTNPMVVAVTDDFADSHGLPGSDRFPWDVKKGRYFVKVFHQLHCLKFIRRAFVDYERGKPPRLDGRHVHHCLDTLRQDVECIADDTLMPTGAEARSIGDAQPLMCRNFSKLVEWVYAPERMLAIGHWMIIVLSRIQLSDMRFVRMVPSTIPS